MTAWLYVSFVIALFWFLIWWHQEANSQAFYEQLCANISLPKSYKAKL